MPFFFPLLYFAPLTQRQYEEKLPGLSKRLIVPVSKRCDEEKAEIVIVDLANVDAIDTAVATHLVRLGKVLELIGVKIVFCGINRSKKSSI